MTHPELPADPSILLDQPPLAPEELTELEGLVRATIGTGNDVIILQAEAILALEAVARAVAAPGTVALNLVSGPYGGVFGGWMTQSGARVTDLVVPFDEVLSVDAVSAAIDELAPAIVAVVHAEAATGGTNPVAEILALARAAGALTIVDAVASVGAEPVAVDDWGVDIAVIGAQKSLAGTAGVSAVSVSERAWAVIDANPTAPQGSSLSLLDWRDGWLRTDRSAIPGMPSWLESRALGAALRRVLGEGIGGVSTRHRRAARAVIAAAGVLGLQPWQGTAAGRAPVVTTLRLPEPAQPSLRDGALGGIISPGNGALFGKLLRVNHTGRAANLDPVLDAVRRLASALGQDSSAAEAAARDAWNDRDA